MLLTEFHFMLTQCAFFPQLNWSFIKRGYFRNCSFIIFYKNLFVNKNLLDIKVKSQWKIWYVQGFQWNKLLIKSQRKILRLFLAIKHNDETKLPEQCKDSGTETQSIVRHFILRPNVVHRIPVDFILRNTFKNCSDEVSGLVTPTRKMTQPLFTSSSYGFYCHLLWVTLWHSSKHHRATSSV